MRLPPALRDDEYLHWVKRLDKGRYNLVISGLLPVKWSELGMDPAALEITGENSYGYPPLLERIAVRYGTRPENVVPALGASMANFLLMAALLEPGDRVLVESPAYEPLYRTAEFVGAALDFFERRFEDGYRVDPERVAAALTPRTRLVVVTNLHNPSGVLLDEQTLLAVGEAAARVGAYVLVDEAYLDFAAGVRTAFLLGDRFLSTSSLTKVYGLSGLRCGWVLAPADIAERARRVSNCVHGEGVLLAEIAAAHAFDRIEWLADRSRCLMEANRALLDRFLAAHGEDLQCVPPHAGTICFPRLRHEVGTGIPAGIPARPGLSIGTQLATLLRENYETLVVPGDFFSAPRGSSTGACSLHVRISFGNDTAVVRDGLTRVSRALRGLSGEQSRD